MSWQNKLAIFITLLFILGSSLVSLHRYWQFEVDHYDFGILDTAIWKVSRFQAPIVDHFVVAGKWIFADHFYPSLFLLAPLYWFTQRQEIIFIAQSLSVGLAGLVLFHLAKRETRSAIGSFAILISFFSFIGLQNALWFDIHEVTFMTLPLTLMFYTFFTHKTRLFWLTFILALGFKESSFVTLIGFSIFMFLDKKSWTKTAIISAIFALVYGLLVIKLVIPHFSGAAYSYNKVFSYDWRQPNTYLQIFSDSPIKLNTLKVSFSSFGFLPLFALPLWPSYLLHFLTRFTSDPIRWDIGLHYSAEIAPFLALGTLLVLRFLHLKKQHFLLILTSIWLTGCSLFLFRFKHHGPLLLATNPVFYAQTPVVNYPNTILNQIPPGSYVMAQQNLATHLNHQHQIILLREGYADYRPDYIIFDSRPGLNPSHYFGISDPELLFESISQDNHYQLVDQHQTVKLFKRIP